MASFEREKDLVQYLLPRLDLSGAEIHDPNAGGTETGIDVSVKLADGRMVGVRVTEIDAHDRPGFARAQETKDAKAAAGGPYSGWAQNNPAVIRDAIKRSIERKVEIAAKHSFDGYNEVWLLLCASIPEPGAVVATFVMPKFLTAEDLNLETDDLLQQSKYHRCFLLPIISIGDPRPFYQWSKPSRWEKRVESDGIRHVPRAE